MPVIDADCHVIECEETWEYMEGEDRRYQPRILEAADQSDPLRRNDFWLFDSNLEPKRAFPSVTSGTTPESSELRDVEARLEHMDELGTDIQVLYPTTLLGLATLSRPRTQIAMCRAYNRWMGDVWRKGKGRLRWVATLPLETMDVALEELRLSRDNGACGFLLQGLMGERVPIDEYYFPVYAEASRLDMPVCIHSGLVNHALSGIFHSRATALWMAKVPIITAFHALVLSRVPDRFPDLRWGFLEAAASWVPYVITDLGARLDRTGTRKLDENVLRRNRFYVACQTEEDLPYILQHAGEDHIVIGSDYGHADTSSQLEALNILQENKSVNAEARRKIVDDNARALYGL
ncbi:MAG: amidohydrolase family protein [Deltaproteobacteria bacterium]|nr:amidohydrolase family protein [Deltaproteobacteria bacterium]